MISNLEFRQGSADGYDVTYGCLQYMQETHEVTHFRGVCGCMIMV